MLWIPLPLLHLQLSFAILKTCSGLLHIPWAYLYRPPPQAAPPLCFMKSASHFPSSLWPWLSLVITQPHPDTSMWGQCREIQMVWGDKRGILHAPYKHSKLTCHPHLSNSTPMCHMAKVVCLLKPGFSSVQSLSHVRLFATPWITARQASLSITNSQSSPRLTSIESMMPSSHLILCHPPSPPAPNPSQHQSLFQWVNFSHEVAKVILAHWYSNK